MRKLKYLLIAIILIIADKNAFCQFQPFQDDDAIITPNFRTDLIHAKRISRITIHCFSKPDGEPIKDDKIWQQYFFDSTGKMTESLCLTRAGKAWDTTNQCKYLYDDKNNLIIKRTQMGDFYDAWYYKWNKDNLLQTEYHVQETTDANAGEQFDIAHQRVISQDSFAYIIYPKQTQQYVYNEDNKIFKKTIVQYDDNKRFISRNSHYAVGWLYSEVDIQYDSVSGRISSYINSGNLAGEMNKKTTIQYDSLGNIASQDIWETGKQTHHVEYMYDSETGFISNKLDRDFPKAVIYILRFSYEKYNDSYTLGTK